MKSLYHFWIEKLKCIGNGPQIISRLLFDWHWPRNVKRTTHCNRHRSNISVRLSAYRNCCLQTIFYRHHHISIVIALCQPLMSGTGNRTNSISEQWIKTRTTFAVMAHVYKCVEHRWLFNANFKSNAKKQ